VNEFYTLKGYSLNENNLLTPALEDYLEMIYRLGGMNIKINILSEKLNVKASSVSKMANKLKALNLLILEKYKSLNLTEKGFQVGNYLFYRHQTLSSFLKYLNKENYSLKQVEKIEHFVDDITLKNISLFLNKPLLVNKLHHLKKDYVPRDLVLIDKLYTPKENIHLNKEALESFILMTKELNLDIKIASAYRTFSYQEKLYNDYFKEFGLETDTFSAKPGTSEHQTGLAIDIMKTNDTYENFGNTKEHLILLNKAHLYGFIFRYPKGKESITGYKYEPWHLRYVGECAEIIYKENLTLEEYLEKRN
jgi:D-alanyl-D-alanine carboxypeptidase